MAERKCRECGETDLSKLVKSKQTKDGLCNICRPCMTAYTTAWRKDNPGRLAGQAAASKRQREDAKRQVFEYYGSACACCGESEILFLTVEHMDGGGRKHRKTMKTQTIYVWLMNNGFPEGFEILCYNCNCVKRVNGGVCPHQS